VRLADLHAQDREGRVRLTWRELLVYVRQLPPGSRTHLAAGQTDGLWGLSEHLLALAIDELRAGNWQRSNEGVKRGQQSKRPVPIPRPGTGRASDKHSPERVAKRAAARERARARRASLQRTTS